MTDAFFDYLLRRGDDCLITAQRLGEWYAGAHEMEEDVALANIALDQLGTARLLLTYAGAIEGAGRDEDALAYLRDEREFRNCLLAELPNGDFGHTIVRLLFVSAYQWLLYDRTAEADGVDEHWAAIAAKARKESAYHLDHSAQWTVRLGDGTEESHRRMRDAVDELWPYTGELFESETTGGRAIDPATLRADWLSTVEPVLAEATLAPPAQGWTPEGGRRGVHTEHLGYLLAEMQSLRRAHPEATW